MDDKMLKDSVKMRARAMRLADVLSRVQISSQKDIEDNASKRRWKYDAFMPPPFNIWPEINVDFLLPENKDQELLYDDCAKGPAMWPLDHAQAMRSPNGGIQLVLVKTILPKTLRGKARRLSQYNIAGYSIYLDADGGFEDYGSGFYGLFNKRWMHLLKGGNYVSGCVAEPSYDGVRAIIGAAVAQRYQWSAVFSFENGIKLRFGCSARGALVLFKDRDKPEFGRRKSLLHWVRKHWRQTSTLEESRAVRQHLRGITNFQWRGLQVSIIPAEYELETMKEAV
jgi:hypothetical protein